MRGLENRSVSGRGWRWLVAAAALAALYTPGCWCSGSRVVSLSAPYGPPGRHSLWYDPADDDPPGLSVVFW